MLECFAPLVPGEAPRMPLPPLLNWGHLGISMEHMKILDF
jgi:hypothetical protein